MEKKTKKSSKSQKMEVEKVPKAIIKKTDSPLPKDFYSTDVVTLSKDLLGKILVHRLPDGKELKSMIVETEAYKAPDDKGCHAYNNKKTERTKNFWTDGGHIYMYSIYGPNNCMNVVAADKTKPEAVLIRAIEPLEGLEIMKSNRKTNCKKIKDLTNGPAKLTQAMGIDKGFNGYDMTQVDPEVYIVANDSYKFETMVSTRINIDYAGEWKDKPWRFYIKNNDFVSIKLPKDVVLKE